MFDAWSEAGKDVSAYDRDALMSVDYDETETIRHTHTAQEVITIQIRRHRRQGGDKSRHLPSGETVAVEADGMRAQALVASVGDAVGSSTASGSSILAFCQRVQLALLLEEEEEPLGPDYEVEETAS